MADNNTGNTKKQQLGFWGLTAIVFGMMVGAGIFNIPQNMAVNASLGAVSISWLITAAGMLLLVATFKTLADRRPDLDAGIYQYALAGFGKYIGFNMAWGYWLCICFANIAYAVMLCESFGAFFPGLKENGWSTLIFGSLLIWIMYLLVVSGIRTAKFINNTLSVVKVAIIAIIIVMIWINVKTATLTHSIWGESYNLGGVGEQIKSTMLVTLWCFIGIEGAVMMSARAKRHSDVGKAGVAGFSIAWLLYVLVSVLCFGIMTQPQLSGLDNPSVAYLLRSICGDWAYYFVITAVIVSLLGGWVAWTLVCAQMPYEASKAGIFPRRFQRLNNKGMPAFGLAVSSIIMQVFLVIVITANDFYMAALSITGMMILPCYLFSGLYLWKTTLHPELLGLSRGRKNIRFRLTGIACSIFCFWMLYAGGLSLLLLTSVFYIAGTGFYITARREDRRLQSRHEAGLFTKNEKIIFAFLLLCSIISIYMVATGAIAL